MGFGDLKKSAGQGALNDFLADRSFIDGYTISQADVVVFQALSDAPCANLNNALRWYNQVKTYSSQFSSLPGIKKDVSEYGAAAPAAKPAVQADDDDDDDDDDIDLFGESDEEEEAAFKAMEEKRKAEQAKQQQKKKAPPIAKSNIILDVKPWDDETDMDEIERSVRSIQMDGLVWGASKFVAIGYGIKKLQITCVVVDDKVGTDDLEEKITAFEDIIQSMDVAAFNKV